MGFDTSALKDYPPPKVLPSGGLPPPWSNVVSKLDSPTLCTALSMPKLLFSNREKSSSSSSLPNRKDGREYPPYPPPETSGQEYPPYPPLFSWTKRPADRLREGCWQVAMRTGNPASASCGSNVPQWNKMVHLTPLLSNKIQNAEAQSQTN